MKNKFRLAVSILLLISLLPMSATMQTGGQFAIEQSVIASGGGQNSTGGNFSLDGTIGQPIAGGALSGSPFSVTSGFWNFSPAAPSGFEADVAPRTGGDGLIQANDIVQLRRFLNTADTPDPSTNEFQRADSAPFASRGDGFLQANDVVQARRYLNTADAPQQADGPTAPSGGNQPETVGGESEKEAGKGIDNQSQADAPFGSTRNLRVESTFGSPNQMVTVNIRVDAVGDESVYAFRLSYASSILSNPVVGSGNAGAAILDCFTPPAGGQLNCTIEAFPTNNPTSSNANIREIADANNQILLTVRFQVAGNAPTGATPLTLSNVSTSNDAAQSLAITPMNGTVTISGPTAASVQVAGRVLTPSGRGLTNATVLLTEADGTTRQTRTTTFGYYRFEAVAVGRTYIFSVQSKRYQFAPQVVIVAEEIEGLNFTANPSLEPLNQK